MDLVMNSVGFLQWSHRSLHLVLFPQWGHIITLIPSFCWIQPGDSVCIKWAESPDTNPPQFSYFPKCFKIVNNFIIISTLTFCNWHFNFVVKLLILLSKFMANYLIGVFAFPIVLLHHSCKGFLPGSLSRKTMCVTFVIVTLFIVLLTLSGMKVQPYTWFI